MSFKFNRNCWVESREDSLQDTCDGIMVPVDRKMALARTLFNAWHERLRSHERVSRLLREVEQANKASQAAMVELGIAAACARCDATAPEGSCCSRGLEHKYDAIHLLINLLLGARFPEKRLREDSCYFLGFEGCRLKVKHMLCIDYLCPELEQALGPQALIRMQTIAGRAVESAFWLMEAIKAMILR